MRAKSTFTGSPRNARPLGSPGPEVGQRWAGERFKLVKTAAAQASLTCFLRSVMTVCISRISVFKSLVAGPSKGLWVADVALLRCLPYFTLKGKEKIQNVSEQA